MAIALFAPSIDFSPPHNWCDSCCARCPVFEDCKVGTQMRDRRWEHQIRGEDPDDVSVVMDDVTNRLTQALTLLAQTCEEQGIEWEDEPIPEPVESVELREAALAYAMATKSVVDAACLSGPSQETGEEAVEGGFLLGAKVSRIAWHEADTADIWNSDSVPNILLIELIKSRVDAHMEKIESRVAPATMRAWIEARDFMWKLLADSRRRVPASARSTMLVLAASGRAPSPFCVRERSEQTKDGSLS